MIILDTNVISAMTAEVPDKTVIGWLDNIRASEVYTTAVSVFELMVGVERMNPGRRQDELRTRTDNFLTFLIGSRILPITADCARAAAALNGRRKLRGITVDARDTLIAGACIVSKATLATGNVRDFADAGFPIINPWAP